LALGYVKKNSGPPWDLCCAPLLQQVCQQGSVKRTKTLKQHIHYTIYAEVVYFSGRLEAIGLPAIQQEGCPTEK